ncbi:hypothetical protein [Ectopseudomonas alcaliphila]|uniref:Uncharacterized protein n=1 Tax=Ectopseudomonas alcaliphila TaxID=101564 RepID=A0A1G7MJ43_9GAMM|nr:hypothetical protein [Pseudomonas alcaliphila]MDX5994951.1 hypothetical protein [Pseudomonas alcaliphila]SDF61772.1 hypothetical protein SAMN05216575_10968 [Pseudomonas alcaliphila]
MTTLAEQRADIARRMRESRQGTSEVARRAGGQAMIERRTGRAEVDDINALVTQPRQRKPLPDLAPRGSVAPQVGRGEYQAAGGGGGGGVASPFTETPGTRTYHENTVIIQSTDGSTFMAVRMPAVVTMTDANGAPAVFNYAEIVDG